ncbi:MAG: hemerythrin domain-containing protein [Pirellulales bacterium]
MATAAYTVSINPAFLREIKEDHHELRQLMHHTTAMLGRPEWMSVEFDRLVELFGKLRDQLAMHFSLEEAYGYFDDALGVAPRLSRRADVLRSQHYELYRDICRLAERAEQLLYHETPEPMLGRLGADFRQFVERFQEHEQHECDLIMEALNEELGAGD